MEDTIEAQEVIEGDGDHAEELDDLAKEGNQCLYKFLVVIIVFKTVAIVETLKLFKVLTVPRNFTEGISTILSKYFRIVVLIMKSTVTDMSIWSTFGFYKGQSSIFWPFHTCLTYLLSIQTIK